MRLAGWIALHCSFPNITHHIWDVNTTTRKRSSKHFVSHNTQKNAWNAYLDELAGRQAGKQAGSLPVEGELFRGTWCTFGTYPAGIVSVRFRWSSMSALSLLWLLKRMSVRPSIHLSVHQSVPTTAGAMFICPSATVSVHGFICLSGWRIKKHNFGKSCWDNGK